MARRVLRTVRMARRATDGARRARWLARLRAVGRRIAVSPAGARAGEVAAGLAYHRREIIAVALVAACLLGGLAVERGRAAAPAVAARLEVEAPPPRPPPRPPGPRRRIAEPRRPGPVAPATHAAAPVPAAPRPPCGPGPPGWPGPLDLNRATGPELAALPGFGPRLATRVLARRDALGGRFTTIADLAGVSGVGRQRAETLAPWVVIGPAPAPAAAWSGPADRRDAPPGPDKPAGGRVDATDLDAEPPPGELSRGVAP